MTPATYDINIYQGATFTLDVTVKDSEGNAKDISGYIGSGMIKIKATDTTALAEFDVNVHQDDSGMVTISLSAEDTDALPTRGTYYKEKETYYYDIELHEDRGDTVIRLLQGKAYVYPSITKTVVTP